MVQLLKEMEEYAKENNIPIMMDDGLKFIEDYIKKNNVKRILEIGSAIGYSAIRMCLNENICITTIERDEVRYKEAVKNIKKAKLENQITLIYDDALNIDLDEKYDLIFIDAAKGQYIKFFEKFEKNLSEKGAIISDNLKFHGYTEQKERIKSKNLRQLVNKIRKYIEFLKENNTYQTTFYDIGDVQLLAAGRQLGGLGFRLIDRCPGELLQRSRWNGWRVAGVLRYVVNIGKADSRRACQ